MAFATADPIGMWRCVVFVCRYPQRDAPQDVQIRHPS